MAEVVVVVCDVCGKAPAKSATIRVGTVNRVKDYCEAHLAALLDGSRAPRRGRRPGSTNASSNRRKSTEKSSAKKSTSRKRATARK